MPCSCSTGYSMFTSRPRHAAQARIRCSAHPPGLLAASSNPTGTACYSPPGTAAECHPASPGILCAGGQRACRRQSETSKVNALRGVREERIKSKERGARRGKRAPLKTSRTHQDATIWDMRLLYSSKTCTVSGSICMYHRAGPPAVAGVDGSIAVVGERERGT